MPESHGKDLFEINNVSLVCFKSSSDTNYKSYFLSLFLIFFLLKESTWPCQIPDLKNNNSVTFHRISLSTSN